MTFFTVTLFDFVVLMIHVVPIWLSPSMSRRSCSEYCSTRLLTNSISKNCLLRFTFLGKFLRCYVIQCQIMPCYVIQCAVMQYYVMSCSVKSCPVMSCVCTYSSHKLQITPICIPHELTSSHSEE